MQLILLHDSIYLVPCCKVYSRASNHDHPHYFHRPDTLPSCTSYGSMLPCSITQTLYVLLHDAITIPTQTASNSCAFALALHFISFLNAHHAQRCVSCNATKWITIWILVAVTVLAQMAITLRFGPSPRVEGAFHVKIKSSLRIYAITGRNKFFAGALSVMVIAQLSYGIFLTVFDSRGTSESTRLFSFVSLSAPRWSSAGDKLRRFQPLYI